MTVWNTAAYLLWSWPGVRRELPGFTMPSFFPILSELNHFEVFRFLDNLTGTRGSHPYRFIVNLTREPFCDRRKIFEETLHFFPILSEFNRSCFNLYFSVAGRRILQSSSEMLLILKTVVTLWMRLRSLKGRSPHRKTTIQ